MRDLKTVIAFTIKDMVQRKSFIISTLIILVLIVIGFNIPNIMKALTNGEESSSADKVLVVDSTNLFEGTLENLNQMELGDEFQITNDNVSFDEIKTKIENEDIDEAILIEQKDDGTYTLRYIVENKTQVASVPEDIINAVSTIYTNLQISKLGLTQEQILSLTPNFEVSIEQTEEQEVSGNIGVMMIMSLILFYAIYFCA